MSEIKLNINAPITNITIASSINTQLYLQSQSTENKNSADRLSPDLKTEKNNLIEIIPVFKKEYIDEIFSYLYTYFSEDDQIQLMEVLKTGNLPKTKLFFMGNCKTLLDFFKQLMNGQFLTISVQSDLEKWISNGFLSLRNNQTCIIKSNYASKIISGTERAAEGNRLIDVNKLNGKFVIEQLEIKNRIQEKQK